MTYSYTILITGGTQGLGWHCAKDIAKQLPDRLIVVASRTDPTSAAATINRELDQENVIYRPLDLGSLAKVRSFVKEWQTENHPSIEALVLNAGVQIPGDVRMTEDGIEMTFAINHVGHALLFHLLSPYLSNNARVVVVSSGTHDPAQKAGQPDAYYNTAEELANPTAESSRNQGTQRYTTSKLCNILWTYQLHKRLLGLSGGRKITVTAFDPGLIPGTNIIREANPVLKWMWYNIWPHVIPLLRLVLLSNTHTMSESGSALAWLAVSPDVEGKSGVYYEGRTEIKSSVDSYDETKQEDLWQWTVKRIANSEEEAQKFDTLSELAR